MSRIKGRIIGFASSICVEYDGLDVRSMSFGYNVSPSNRKSKPKISNVPYLASKRSLTERKTRRMTSEMPSMTVC